MKQRSTVAPLAMADSTEWIHGQSGGAGGTEDYTMTYPWGSQNEQPGGTHHNPHMRVGCVVQLTAVEQLQQQIIKLMNQVQAQQRELDAQGANAKAQSEAQREAQKVVCEANVKLQAQVEEMHRKVVASQGKVEDIRLEVASRVASQVASQVDKVVASQIEDIRRDVRAQLLNAQIVAVAQMTNAPSSSDTKVRLLGLCGLYRSSEW